MTYTSLHTSVCSPRPARLLQSCPFNAFSVISKSIIASYFRLLVRALHPNYVTSYIDTLANKSPCCCTERERWMLKKKYNQVLQKLSGWLYADSLTVQLHNGCRSSIILRGIKSFDSNLVAKNIDISIQYKNN